MILDRLCPHILEKVTMEPLGLSIGLHESLYSLNGWLCGLIRLEGEMMILLFYSMRNKDLKWSSWMDT